jgi:hypothetical protein
LIRTIDSYLRDQVYPRRTELIRDGQLWIAVILGGSVAVFASDWGIANSTVGDILTVVLAYAAVAFGFCLAGLTVALTLPDEKFVYRLATMEPSEHQMANKRRVANAYSDLLFVFSWTAIAHWLVICFGVFILVACGSEHKLVAGSYGPNERLLLGILSFLVVYALSQFLITLITLSQVGNRYVGELKSRSAPDSGRRS